MANANPFYPPLPRVIMVAMKRCFQFCLIALILLCAGCHPGRSLIGKWAATAQGHPVIMEFAAGSKLALTIQVEKPMAYAVTVTGTYNAIGDTLGAKFTDMSVKTSDPAMQSRIDQYIAMNKQGQIEEMSKKRAREQVEWKSDDEFVAVDPDGTKTTYTRIKS